MKNQKAFVRLSILLGIATLAGVGVVRLHKSAPNSLATPAGCETCSAPLTATSAGLQPSSTCAIEAIEADVAGPMQFVLTYNNVPVPNGKLTGDFTESVGNSLPMPIVLPTAGTDELVIYDDDGDIVGVTSIFVNSTSVLAPNPYLTPIVVPNVPPGANRTGIQTQQSAAASVVTAPPAPAVPDEYVQHASDIVPLTNVTTCATQTVSGNVYYVVPINSYQGLPVDNSYKLLVRKNGGQPVKKGKKCRVRPPQDGKPCPSPIPNYCTPPVVTAIGAPAPMSVTVGVDVLGSGGTVTITFWSQPYKRVSKCDVYKCVNGALVYDYTQKCVNMGSQGWSFSPGIAYGDVVSSVLLGFDAAGWKWQNVPTCTRM